MRLVRQLLKNTWENIRKNKVNKSSNNTRHGMYNNEKKGMLIVLYNENKVFESNHTLKKSKRIKTIIIHKNETRGR